MKSYLLLALIICAVFFWACNKDLSSLSTDHSSLPAAFSIPISHQEKLTIDALLAQGHVKSPWDFRTIIDSIKSTNKELESRKQVTLRLQDDDYSESEDEFNEATTTYSYPNEIVSTDYVTGKKTIRSQFQRSGTFISRGNSIQITVPFQYDWGLLPGAGTNTITNLRASTPVTLNPVGAYWGTVTQGTSQYVNGGWSSSPWDRSAGIDAFADAQEIRTKIRSTTGQIKISTNANVIAFEIGSELETGFTIQSAENIYNYYTMSAYGDIWIEGITSGYNTLPSTQFQGTYNALQYGILRN